jgi:hypothetical protein
MRLLDFLSKRPKTVDGVLNIRRTFVGVVWIALSYLAVSVVCDGEMEAKAAKPAALV